MQSKTQCTRGALNRRHLLIGATAAAALPLAPALPAPARARAVTQAATHEDERLMRLAIAEAKRGDYPFGAIIVRDGKVLVKGRNLGKQRHDPTAHGEMVAIRRFLAAHGPEKLKGTTLYTSAEPCCMCMGAIVWCGIARVVFAASIDQTPGQIMISAAEVADKTPFETVDITGGVLASEAVALFK
jgi:tRNA(Arg) A34 adenosine deaminase TadA